MGSPDDRPLVAHVGRFPQGGVVAGHDRAGKAAQPGVVGWVDAPGDGTHGRVAVASDLVLRGRRPDPLDEHPVLGEGARLVGADHVDGPERLHGGQLPDQRPTGGQPLGAEREGHRHHRRQGLGDRRDRETHGGQEHQLDRLSPRDAGHEHDGAHHERDRGQALTQARQSALEWGLTGAVCLEQVGDVAERRRHARRHHHATPSAAGHGRALEGHVPLVGQDGVRDRGQGIAGLDGGLGLAGQGRLVDAQCGDVQEPGIRRDDVAGLEQQDVPGDDLRGGDGPRGAITHHPGTRARHLLERSHRPLCTMLLDEPDDPVEDHDREDHDRVLDVPDERGDQRGDEEHHDHRVRELIQEQSPGRRPVTLDELVGAVSRAALLDLDGTQAMGRVRVDRSGDARGVHRPGSIRQHDPGTDLSVPGRQSGTDDRGRIERTTSTGRTRTGGWRHRRDPECLRS